MEKMSNKREYEIPAGYEARIDGNKVIIEKKESEDERIRKGLINGFKYYSDQEYWGTEKYPLKIKDIIGYLEKQGEHKPIEWTAEDEEELKIALNTLEEAGQYSSAKWLKNVCLVPQTKQKPAWKPTHEQINALYERVLKGGCCNGELMSLYNDLLKLKE